jgi:hypothetical protein
MNLPDKIEPTRRMKYGTYKDYLSPEAKAINQLIDYLAERIDKRITTQPILTHKHIYRSGVDIGGTYIICECGDKIRTAQKNDN